MQPIGKAALIASVGGQRGYADWTNPDHRLRRLLSEFIGMAGLTFILSGGAAILARYGGRALQPWQTVLVLSAVSALWLVVAVYFLGDISAHFNPATTLAFALRRDMGWIMAGAYWTVQFAAAICGSLLARAFFGPAGNLAATMPKPGLAWQAAGFEAILTFGLVLMILNLANGPKLNGPFVPLAVGAYILGWGTMGGPFDGASMNPARSFGPDVALGNLSTWWVMCPRGCTKKPMHPQYGVRSEDQQHATTSTDWTNQQVIHASGDRSRRGRRRCVYRQNLVWLTRTLVVGVGDTPSCHVSLSITAPSTLTCRREGRRAPGHGRTLTMPHGQSAAANLPAENGG